MLVKDIVISPFREGFVFTKLRICEVSRKLNTSENKKRKQNETNIMVLNSVKHTLKLVYFFFHSRSDEKTKTEKVPPFTLNIRTDNQEK